MDLEGFGLAHFQTLYRRNIAAKFHLLSSFRSSPTLPSTYDQTDEHS